MRIQTGRRFGLLAMILGLLPWAGCGSQQPGNWDGPKVLSTSSVDTWQFKGKPGWKLSTTHYAIYTTIEEDDLRMTLPQVMEGAFTQYRLITPAVRVSDKPMDCFIFNGRQEFNEYTKENAGNAAGVYLAIRRGGYAMKDRYVSYNLGLNATASIAAHEGWHQFASRNFIGRLPPFLEEGLATTFEGVTFTDRLPRWNPAINPTRAQALRRTIEEKHLWPLEQLIRTHAGEVVNRGGDAIDAFYSQSWAFAKFMREADGGKYAPALRLWLAETAAGTVYDPSHSHSRAGLPWNPAGVKPMLEHYLGMGLPEIEKAYLLYIHRVVYEEYPKQWNLSGWNGN